MPPPRRIFFSYSSADRVFATRLAKSLAEQGLELDRVESSTPAVRNGIDQLEKQVLSADAVVLLINPRSKFDELQQRIWQAILGAAWEDPELPLLPLLLRDAELPPFVRSAAPRKDVQAIRIQDPSDLDGITWAILDRLGPESSARSMRSMLPPPIERSPSGSGVFNDSDDSLPGDFNRGKSPASVSLEIYPFSAEADRKERLERLAELQEYVEQLKR